MCVCVRVRDKKREKERDRVGCCVRVKKEIGRCVKVSFTLSDCSPIYQFICDPLLCELQLCIAYHYIQLHTKQRVWVHQTVNYASSYCETSCSHTEFSFHGSYTGLCVQHEING